MQKSPFLRREVLAPFLAVAVAVVVLAELTASAASTIYYCPDRKGDQQYSAQAGPGCIPLVDKKTDRQEGMPQQHFQPDSLQQDVSAFLTRYQKFLECCK